MDWFRVCHGFLPLKPDHYTGCVPLVQPMPLGVARAAFSHPDRILEDIHDLVKDSTTVRGPLPDVNGRNFLNLLNFRVAEDNLIVVERPPASRADSLEIPLAC